MPLRVRLDIIAGKDIARQMASATAAQVAAAERAHAETVLSLHAAWRKNVRVDTGTYRRSIAFEMPQPFAGRIFTRTRYAVMEEFGTRPHTIRPRRRKVLRFQVGGETVFAKKVQHPGTRGSLALTRARQSEAPRYRQRLIEALNVNE